MAQTESILFFTAIGAYFLTMILNFVFIGTKKEIASRVAFWTMAGGLAIHTAALVLRGINAGRIPMTNRYEFSASFAWALCLVSLVFIRKYRFPVLGVFAAPVIFLVMGYAAMQNREIHTLMPVLQSNWLIFHVSTAILAYGSFGVSFALGLIYLIRGRMKEEGFWGQHIPRREKLDLIEYRSVCLGLLFLTMTIITGAIWAKYSWGSYWSWDPKETWSLVTWIIYAVYLHLRIIRGWKGKAAAVFAVVGFLCVLFTYVGVNTFLPGLHSYAT